MPISESDLEERGRPFQRQISIENGTHLIFSEDSFVSLNGLTESQIGSISDAHVPIDPENNIHPGTYFWVDSPHEGIERNYYIFQWEPGKNTVLEFERSYREKHEDRRHANGLDSVIPKPGRLINVYQPTKIEFPPGFYEAGHQAMVMKFD